MHTPVLDHPENDAPPAAGQAVSLPLIVAFLIWPLIVAGVACLFMHRYMQTEIDTELSLRPRVAILDTHQFVEQQPTTLSPDDRLKAGFKKANETSKRLQDAGFLILDRGQVLSAPAGLQVPSAAK